MPWKIRLTFLLYVPNLKDYYLYLKGFSFSHEINFQEPLNVKQGVNCDRFLGHTHAPRTSRFRSARTRVRTSNWKGSHFAPAPAHLR